jgi:hypothetical protein
MSAVTSPVISLPIRFEELTDELDSSTARAGHWDLIKSGFNGR